LLFRGAEQAEVATAAAGISEEGWLVYAELAGSAVSEQRGPAVLQMALTHAGVRRPVYLRRAPSVRLGDRDLDLHPRQSAAQGVFLRPWLGSGTAMLFPDTPVVSRRVWQPLQARTGLPKTPQPADGSGAAAEPP
jgi:hypothetical protein